MSIILKHPNIQVVFFVFLFHRIQHIHTAAIAATTPANHPSAPPIAAAVLTREETDDGVEVFGVGISTADEVVGWLCVDICDCVVDASVATIE
jgi:hypothetical protein